MSNIILFIIIINRINYLTGMMFLGLSIYTIVAFLAIKIASQDHYEDELFADKAIKKYKMKVTLIILLISGGIHSLTPTQDELTFYFGSKLITTQNYHMAKDELLSFVRDLRKEIKGESHE